MGRLNWEHCNDDRRRRCRDDDYDPERKYFWADYKDFPDEKEVIDERGAFNMLSRSERAAQIKKERGSRLDNIKDD